jgi:hypothetical protein
MSENYYGTTLADLTVNDRVAIHPACDLFMQGALYATVVKIGRKWIHATFDRDGKTRQINPNLLRKVDMPTGYSGATDLPSVPTVTVKDDYIHDHIAEPELPESSDASPANRAWVREAKPDPRNVARWANMHRFARMNEEAATFRKRVQDVRERGYKGPILRSDLTVK